MTEKQDPFLWWKHGVIYQIYPRSFQDSNGDGIGDLKGIISRLDYLAGLGVDGIWLSPIYKSPMKDFGYDISDYRDLDPDFGTLEEFRTLVSEAHSRGIRIIMDMVLNHSSDQHPWFQEALSSPDSPKREWYVWHKGKNGRKPNNWRAAFGGPAWTWDEKSREYYLHLFLKEQPDLNWRNEDLKQAVFDMLRYWLDMGVDGFRLDVINFIIKDEQFRSNPYGFHRAHPRRFEQQNHIYERSRPESHTILKEMRLVLDEYPETMSVGEIFPNENVQDPAASAAYLGSGEDELHLAFDFSPNSAVFKADCFARILGRWYDTIPGKGWPCHVLSNHDQSRSMSRLAKGDPEKMKILLTMLLTQRGTPFLYYGDEIGMEDGKIPRKDLQDPVGVRYWPFDPGRDPERTPMQWDSSPGAGFTTGTPWLPLSGQTARASVAAQEGKKGTLLELTRSLTALRKNCPPLMYGDWTLLASKKGILAYSRRWKDREIRVYLNFTKREIGLTAGGRILLSTSGRKSAVPVSSLGPLEALILEI